MKLLLLKILGTVLSIFKYIIIHIFQMPILDAKIIEEPSQRMLGYSHHQNGGSVYIRDAKVNYCLSVKYILAITNNSSITAYKVSITNAKGNVEEGTLQIDNNEYTLKDGDTEKFVFTYSKEFYEKSGDEIKKEFCKFHWSGDIVVGFKKKRRQLNKTIKIKDGKIV